MEAVGEEAARAAAVARGAFGSMHIRREASVERKVDFVKFARQVPWKSPCTTSSAIIGHMRAAVRWAKTCATSCGWYISQASNASRLPIRRAMIYPFPPGAGLGAKQRVANAARSVLNAAASSQKGEWPEL